MDFSFSEKDKTFADEARTWLEANVPREWRKDHAWSRAEDPLWITIARDWQRMLYEGGWAAIAWPREQGGRGATVIERWLFEEQLDRVGAPRPIASSGAVDLIGSALLHHGTEAQRSRFLKPLLSGADLWCQGFSEPGAGSDLGSLRTRGDRDGDHFVVNGQKVWTSHADIADWCFLLCRTEPDAPKHKGISLLLVDMRTPGISVRPLKQMTGDAEFCEVFFDNVRVPADLMVGAPGAGWQIAMGILAHERGPVWTFTFQRRIRRSFERLVRVARQQGAGNGALTDPLLRQRLAQSHIEVELLRFVGYRSLTKLLRTGQPGVESSIEKVLGSETDQRLQEVAMQVLGAYGSVYDERCVAPSEAIAREYMYSRSETIMGGTSEIQRNLIAQRILGLPR
ncbi:MAG TPA: acyl-CoA dehydrogenase family protein [Candidatus Margulisiibacteriota bacterium]|nr:acyl-CoA dehydrogenase family protein [Candidatus Margulisiibacteriota bacterium]